MKQPHWNQCPVDSSIWIYTSMFCLSISDRTAGKGAKPSTSSSAETYQHRQLKRRPGSGSHSYSRSCSRSRSPSPRRHHGSTGRRERRRSRSQSPLVSRFFRRSVTQKLISTLTWLNRKDTYHHRILMPDRFLQTIKTSTSTI